MPTTSAPSLSPPTSPTPLRRHAALWWPWIATALRVGLGVVAIVAGLAKVTDLPASVRAVRAYELLPESLVPFVGNALPLVELILGGMLVVGLLTRWSALAFGLLLVAFCIGIGSAWARGLSIECGCFGGGGPTDPQNTAYLGELIRDGVFLAVAAVVVRFPRSRLSLDSALDLHP